ncbi:MAG: alpha/beta hydrolase-fold protein [candidate division KSB1 bacterium]|nr:alpha/beta hydrolase-fold protein [candidate division KSB1 bacterium]
MSPENYEQREENSMIHDAARLNIILFLIAVCIPLHAADKTESPGHIGTEPLPVKEISFYSESLQRDMYINIVLPRGYDQSGMDYPVLYLCHGLTSNYHEFEHVGVPEYLNCFDMIVVMVDVGNSWYVNWARSADGQHNNYADHVTQDIINYVDSHYRTIDSRKGRAINGISMGGFGAISLGLSHPELFCSIASHSGALTWAAGQRELLENDKDPWVIWEKALQDTVTRYNNIDIDGYSTIPERTPNGQIFVKPQDADAVDPFKLVLQVPRDSCRIST